MSRLATPSQCGENLPVDTVVCVEACHKTIVRKARIIFCKTAEMNLDSAAPAYLTVIARRPEAGVKPPASRGFEKNGVCISYRIQSFYGCRYAECNCHDSCPDRSEAEVEGR